MSVSGRTRFAIVGASSVFSAHIEAREIYTIRRRADDSIPEQCSRTLDKSRRKLSAIGKHVGIVEAEVGTPLFDRHGGRWVLNEEGRLFAPKASQSILYARMGLDLVQSHVKLQTNRLFVGYSTFLHPRLIDVIKHIRLEQRNNVRIEYESWLTEQRGSLSPSGRT